MKILFWLLLIVSVPVSLFTSFVFYVSRGLGLAYGALGEAVCIAGMAAVVVCAVCAVLGVIKLRRGMVKKAVAFVLAGLVYCGLIYAATFAEEYLYTKRLEQSIAERNEQMYGENWDSEPVIVGIPEHYQTVLNKYYAVVRDRWPADRLMDLGALAMADYYGDASLDNVGFALLDLNGDGVDELVIGAVARGDQQGNEIFCIYSNPENPLYSINSVEGNVYYLHAGTADGTYEVEVAGMDLAWVIEPAAEENVFDFNAREGAMDPAGRMTLALTPFSQYK